MLAQTEGNIWSNDATSSQISVTSSGTFNVIFTDANDCEATSNSITVSVSDSPTPTIISDGDTDICDGDSVDDLDGLCAVVVQGPLAHLWRHARLLPVRLLAGAGLCRSLYVAEHSVGNYDTSPGALKSLQIFHVYTLSMQVLLAKI